MGSQTDAVITKDAAVDPVKELTGIRAASLEEIGSEVKNFRGDEKTHSMSPRPKLSKTLTNHEEQSINELFKVLTPQIMLEQTDIWFFFCFQKVEPIIVAGGCTKNRNEQ